MATFGNLGNKMQLRYLGLKAKKKGGKLSRNNKERGIPGKKWEARRPVIRRKCPNKEEWREQRRKGGILGTDNKEGKRGIFGIDKKIAW